MGGRTTGFVCRKFFEFKAVLPYHFATFPIIDQTPELPSRPWPGKGRRPNAGPVLV